MVELEEKYINTLYRNTLYSTHCIKREITTPCWKRGVAWEAHSGLIRIHRRWHPVWQEEGMAQTSCTWPYLSSFTLGSPLGSHGSNTANASRSRATTSWKIPSKAAITPPGLDLLLREVSLLALKLQFSVLFF